MVLVALAAAVRSLLDAYRHALCVKTYPATNLAELPSFLGEERR